MNDNFETLNFLGTDSGFGKNNNSAFIENDNELILIDCGFTVFEKVIKKLDLKKYKVFSMICYLAMGWCIIIKLPLLVQLVGIPGTVLLVSGGIAYTIGAVLYGVGKKHKYIHSIFHLFIVLASVLQFLSILLYVM